MPTRCIWPAPQQWPPKYLAAHARTPRVHRWDAELLNKKLAQFGFGLLLVDVDWEALARLASDDEMLVPYKVHKVLAAKAREPDSAKVREVVDVLKRPASIPVASDASPRPTPSSGAEGAIGQWRTPSSGVEDAICQWRTPSSGAEATMPMANAILRCGGRHLPMANAILRPGGSRSVIGNASPLRKDR